MAEALPQEIFEAPIRPHLLHAVVVAQQAARRSGTAATKSRAQVSGGGRKPYRQKGTGRARQGSIRSPQFSGGGVVFGPQPRSYHQQVNKKLRRAALRCALSLRNREQRVRVVDAIDLGEIKTRRLVDALRGLGVEDCLIVTAERDRTLELSARNLPKVRVLPVAGLNVRDVLAREHLVLTRGALAAIVERLT
jgi:large subunit ribosomal protein L4